MSLFREYFREIHQQLLARLEGLGQSYLVISVTVRTHHVPMTCDSQLGLEGTKQMDRFWVF